MGDLFERRVTDEVFAAARLQVNEHPQFWRTDVSQELAENDRNGHETPFAVEHQVFRLRKMLFAEPQVLRFLGLVCLCSCCICRHLVLVSLSQNQVYGSRGNSSTLPPPLCGHGQSIHRSEEHTSELQ